MICIRLVAGLYTIGVVAVADVICLKYTQLGDSALYPLVAAGIIISVSWVITKFTIWQ